MSRNGIGSASVVLVFAVLGLTIFTVISYISAVSERNLIEAEVAQVQAFYAADSIAEQILAEILTSDATPEYLMGASIGGYWDWDTLSEVVYFVTPVSDTKELYVVAVIGEEGCEVLTWRVYITGEWQSDDRLHVWQGEENFMGSW